jgi:hypothetical protein
MKNSFALSLALVAIAGCLSKEDPAVYVPSDGGSGGEAPGKGVGEPCAGDDECRDGLVCTDGTCQPGHATPAGEPCVISAECADGLYCADGVCAAGGDGEDGAACTSDADCKSGFRCVLVGLKAVCQAEGTVDLGGECTSSGECFGGLACVDGACAQTPESPPFGKPWEGVECSDESTVVPVQAWFHVPRGDDSDADFFRLPFPNDVRRAGSSIDLSGFPTPGADLLGYDLVGRYVDDLEANADGWGAYSAVFFRFSAALDSDTFDGHIGLVDLTTQTELGFFYSYAGSPSNYICGQRVALTRNLGRIFEPGHTYAAWFAVGITDQDGVPVVPSPDLVELLADTMPADPVLAPHWTKYDAFRQWLAAQMIPAADVLGASVFTVGSARAPIESAAAAVAAAAAPTAAQWTLCDSGVASPCPDATGERACEAADPAFHELHALVTMPIFQQGAAPYLDAGGDLAAAATGTADVCMSLTVPTGAPPPAGWPVVVYAHGTGGHFRSHVVAGIAGALAQGVDDGQANVVKAAVLGIDQVAHGPRRAGSTADPYDVFFNYGNPAAARGNPQQAAVDQLALFRFVPTVSFTMATSPTGEAFALDGGAVALFGHGQVGATAAGIAGAYADWDAVVVAGMGAGSREDLVARSSPVNLAAILPFALGDAASDGKLRHGSRNVAVNLLQHGLEGGDAVLYAPLVVATPPPGIAAHNNLQIYGTADTWTPADGQAGWALGAGLDLVDPDASVGMPDPIGNLMPVAPPWSGNRVVGGKTVSAFVRQYSPAAPADGHFVVFDVASAGSDALRFLAGALLGGAPQVGP